MINVLPVFREEGWHSMDLCADMLVKHAPQGTALQVFLPKYRKMLGFLPSNKAKNFDRWYNRWRIYPKYAENLAKQPGFFHIVDHSYAHLASHLPEGRVGIYCHDLDAFKCIFEPDKERRPEWFRKMMSRVFDGFKKARVVFCNTLATRQGVLDLGIWKEMEVIHAPLGVAEEFIPRGEKEYGNYILHVGSCIPRKRIDVLLESFRKVTEKQTDLKLVQAGGNFTREQEQQIRHLNLEKQVEQRKNLTREELARLYRGAKCLLITSEAEGFGLPVIEGLSCGTNVVASDIPALREVGGGVIKYFPVGDSFACAEAVLSNIQKPRLQINENQRNNWTWSNHATIICQAYASFWSK